MKNNEARIARLIAFGCCRVLQHYELKNELKDRFCKPVSNSSGRILQFAILYGLYNLSTARQKDSK